jgi:S1-C subfamily serine protease
MRHSWLAAALAALTLCPAASAQTPDRGVEGPQPVSDQIFNLIVQRRARLGINVNLQAQATDSIGALVDAVTPGGPAANAGIRSGDIITRIDGKSVLESPDGPTLRGQSLPGLRLIELVARLEPNDSVPVEYRRGSERRTTTIVTAGDAGLVMRGMRNGSDFAFGFGRGRAEASPDLMVVPGAPGLSLLLGGELADLELAPMNPELGQYFGASEGVLVVSAPKGTALGVKGGDVILVVDGRKPSGPAHLLRILRSYDRGETVKLDVLRNHKRETVTGRLGDGPTRVER